MYAQRGTQVISNQTAIIDPAFQNVLNLYCKEVKTKVIAVIIERYEGDYIYTLCSIELFENIISNPTAFYQPWNDRVILVYSGIEKVFAVDSMQVKKFHSEMHSLLPNARTEKKIREGLYETTTMANDPIVWRFKIRGDKVLWIRKKIDYQLEPIPYLKF